MEVRVGRSESTRVLWFLMKGTNAQGGVLVTKRDRLALILFCAMATLGSKKF